MTYLHYSLTRVKAGELTESALFPGETPQYVDLTFAGHHQFCTALKYSHLVYKVVDYP